MDASPAQAASNPRESLHSWLSYKGLEKGRSVWPPIVDGAMTLTPAQFSILIEAMDWRRTLAPPPLPQPVLV
jgi:transposase